MNFIGDNPKNNPSILAKNNAKCTKMYTKILIPTDVVDVLLAFYR